MSHTSPRVYLAGPIRSLTYGGATSWRDHATFTLKDLGIAALSPMRGKGYLKGETSVGQNALKDSYEQYPLSTNKAILCRDYRDCTTSDAVIMYLVGAKTVSIGTVMEAAWAHAARVPLIVVIEKDKTNIHEHGLLMEVCNFRVGTMAEAIGVAAAVLLPSPSSP